MSKPNEYCRIADLAREFNLHHSTIYKYIKQKKLTVETCRMNGQSIKMINKKELKRLLNGVSKPVETCRREAVKDMPYPVESLSSSVESIIKENLNSAIQHAIQQQHSQLMKPLEEQALYIAGALTKENQFLKDRLETVLEENKLLREQMKALPAPVEIEELKNKLQQKELEESRKSWWKRLFL